MEFLPAVIEDAAVIVPQLYKDYRLELQAYAEPGEEVFLLQEGIAGAVNAFTLWEGISPLAIIGYYVSGTVLAGVVNPWMVWSNAIIKFPRVHFRVTQAFSDILIEDFGVMENTIRKDNIRGQRLLRAIGCEVSYDTCGVSTRDVELVRYRRSI